MAKVNMSTKLNVSPDELWKTIGGFNALADWHPAVEKSELEEGGQVRKLSLLGGGTIVERLQKMDDTGRLYRYSIESAPLPVANYVSEIRVKESEGGKGCEVEWSSEFEPSGASATDAQNAISGIYEAGFENLKKMFGM